MWLDVAIGIVVAFIAILAIKGAYSVYKALDEADLSFWYALYVLVGIFIALALSRIPNIHQWPLPDWIPIYPETATLQKTMILIALGLLAFGIVGTIAGWWLSRREED